MRGKEKKPVEVPAIEQVRAERERLRYRRRYRQTLRSTVNVLIVVAALAVLVATALPRSGNAALDENLVAEIKRNQIALLKLRALE